MRLAVLSPNWLLVQLGIHINLLQLVKALISMPRYLKDLIQFKKNYRGSLGLLPCLHDWYEEAGVAKGEYFWQDLYVAQEIFKNHPLRHVDIGSRIDGFIAHVASFREVEVFDIRPLKSSIPNVVFRQVDLMNPNFSLSNYCDSLSCLHALEHFGLGRYGDPINPEGHVVGLQKMAELLQPKGLFYLSVPIGREKVEFNGHRIIDPLYLLELTINLGLILEKFAYVDRNDRLIESTKPNHDIEQLSRLPYSLGIFTFIKQA